MYAIVFDIEQETLSKIYGASSYANAYADIKKTLKKYGFERWHGSVYFGNKNKVDAVTCVQAAQELAETYDWFSASVKDIRMLRIEENNDLMPAIKRVKK